jgi:Tol biopolymer transport system component
MVALNLSTITRLSVSTSGTQVTTYAYQPKLSSDGRYVVFRSSASTLVTGDANGALDIFWRDTNLTATTSDDSLVRINLDAAGAESDGNAYGASISSSGRYVVFHSSGTNLVGSDTNAKRDIFWRDTNLTATTADDSIARLSVSSGGTQGDDHSTNVSVSSDGRYVAFQSDATNLVGSDTNAKTDIFWRDTNLTATTADDSIVRLSVAAGGTEGDGNSTAPAISGTGRYVVFVSAATNLVTGDTNAKTDIFWRDTNLTATTADDSIVRLSVAAGGTEGDNHSTAPAVSSDGRYVVFESNATNLVTGDTNAIMDIFWRDTNLTATTADDSIVRLSVAADGTQSDNQSTKPSISSDGRYVVFDSDATNLVTGDTANKRDIFWRDTNLTATTSDDTIVRISVNSSAVQGNLHSYAPTISADGSYIVFSSASTNLVTGDTNAVIDVFTIRLGATTGDDLLLGSAQAEIMLGLAGNDTVSGSLGADTLSGGGGNDVFTFVTADGTDTIADWSTGDSIAVTGSTLAGSITTGTGATTAQNAVELNAAGNTLYIGVDAGAGADITINLTGTFTTANFTISAGAVQYVATVTSSSNSDNGVSTSGDSAGDLSIVGTDNADVINGGQNQDLISAGGGNDTISGLTGNDTIYGADGADVVNGNQGNDLIFGGQGNDALTGEDGADTIYGNQGSDTTFGNNGNDWIHGGQGNDQIYGNTGNDTLFGGQGNDADYGGQGDDLIYGNLGNDTLFGNSGNDTMYGGQGDDLLSGGDGNDRLMGCLGADTLAGGAGNDALSGGEGADLFRCAADGGVDTIADFSSQDAIEIAGSFGSDAITRTVSGDATTLAIDINGDGAADVTIVLTGTFAGTFSPATSGGVTTLSYAEPSASHVDFGLL